MKNKILKVFVVSVVIVTSFLLHYGKVTACPNVATYEKCYNYFK